MEILGFNVLDVVTNPIGSILGGVTGIIAYNGYKLIKSMIKPAQYIDQLFSAIITVLRNADNNFIDKIRNKRIKDDVQKELKESIQRHIKELNDLIEEISD